MFKLISLHFQLQAEFSSKNWREQLHSQITGSQQKRVLTFQKEEQTTGDKFACNSA